MSETNFVAELGFRIDRLVETLTNQQAVEEKQRFERRREQQNRDPISHSPRGSVTIPATGSALTDLGGPESGRRWIVRRVSVCDASGLNVLAPGTSVDLFVTPSVGTVRPENFYWRHTGSPGSDGISSEVIAVIHPNHVIARVEGADVVIGNQYVVGITVEDMDVAGKATNEWTL